MEGQICSYMDLVSSGVLIYFKVSGDEITTDFAFEGDWVNNNESRLTNRPSAINTRAIEDTELFVIRQNDLVTLCAKQVRSEK